MTVITHDWEFYEDGETIRPISVGLKAESGEEYYAVFNNARELCQYSDWLMHNVGNFFRHPKCEFKQYDVIAKEVTEFIRSFEDVSLWADHGAYDHVALAQVTGGTMMNLPPGIPMYTNDIQTLKYLVLKEDNSIKSSPRRMEPIQDPTSKHHALYDARHDMVLYKHYMKMLEL